MSAILSRAILECPPYEGRVFDVMEGAFKNITVSQYEIALIKRSEVPIGMDIYPVSDEYAIIAAPRTHEH